MTVATPTRLPSAMSRRTPSSSTKRCRETGSTKMSMIPPQVRPTANASSSLIPYRTSTATPSPLTWVAISYTAPSTQPPDTEPTAAPPAVTAMEAPGSRGADLNVFTTVAKPAVLPSRQSGMMASRTSRTVPSLEPSAETEHAERRPPSGPVGEAGHHGDQSEDLAGARELIGGDAPGEAERVEAARRRRGWRRRARRRRRCAGPRGCGRSHLGGRRARGGCRGRRLHFGGSPGAGPGSRSRFGEHGLQVAGEEPHHLFGNAADHAFAHRRRLAGQRQVVPHGSAGGGC